MPRATNPWLGRILGERYRVLQKLGEGGMGTVYLAEHVVLGKQFAIKVLREAFSSDEELVRRFQQEAIAASQIGHENIVDITDFGRTPEGALYFVMEKLEGDSLSLLVQRDGPLPPARALPILIQICRALAAAHSRGIVHRDLKPDNVMVLRKDDGSELVKVLDFGISKVTQGQAERITRVGMMMGTPEYMAPEQVDAASADHRVDIYSLGVLAYELVTGKVPFEADTPVKILLKHQAESPQPPSVRRPDLPIPARLEAAILKALAKAPAERHASMADFAHELAACGRELGVVHFTETVPPLPSPGFTAPIKLGASLPPSTPPRVTGPAEALTLPADDSGFSATLVRSPTPPVPGPPRNTLAPEEKAAVRRAPGAVVFVLVLLVLALGGGLGYVVLQRPSPRDDVQPPVSLGEGATRPMPPVPEPVAEPVPEPATQRTTSTAAAPVPVPSPPEPVTVKPKKLRHHRQGERAKEDPYQKIDDLKANPF